MIRSVSVIALGSLLFVACSQVVSSADSAEESNEWDWDLPRDAYLNSDVKYGKLVDERDGSEYKTVKVGDQTWMAQNLNYEYKDGKESFCYEDHEAYCDVSGRLYLWSAIAASENICPEGWRVPTWDDWKDLLVGVGADIDTALLIIADTVAVKMKSRKGWKDAEDDDGVHSGNGTDDFGLSFIPSGRRYSEGGFKSVGGHGYYWLSTERDEDDGYAYTFTATGKFAGPSVASKDDAIAIRCVKK